MAARGLGRRVSGTSDWLFQNVTLEVSTGDRVTLVGPTGSGKSLVLRALALLDPIDEGEISWCGQPIADPAVPEFRSQIMYLQQRSPMVEGTVEDNLKIPFSLHLRSRLSFPQAQVDAFLESLGKDRGFLASRTANLSGGERQIVALLRALLAAPTVLLLDEPSAALDPQATAMLEKLVASWYEAAPAERAYLWVSHDPAQAQRVGKRVIRLRDGRIEAV